jgi:hypothetical protein
MRGVAAVVAVVLLISFSGIRAQDLKSNHEFPEEPTLTWPVLGGALVGLGSWVAGGIVGASIGTNCDHDFCELEGFIYGAAAGGTLGLALGTHVGNRRRGNFALNVLTGGAVWFASLGAYHALGADLGEEDAAAVWVVEPIAQFIATVVVERAVGRAREERHVPRLSVIPRLDGVAVGLSLSF